MTATENTARTAPVFIVRNSDSRILWTFTRPTAEREARQHLAMLRPGFARITRVRP